MIIPTFPRRSLISSRPLNLPGQGRCDNQIKSPRGRSTKSISLALATVLAFWPLAGFAETGATLPAEAPAGSFFARKAYQPHPLPKFGELRDRLPSPIYDENPDWVALYWKAWELGFRNFHEPGPDSHFVSQFIDAAFNQNIFLWDMCFMSMFCNVAHPLVPGIGSLDNFYARQHEDGEICREINRATGMDYGPWMNREGRSLFSRNGFVPPQNPEAPVIYRDRPVPQPAPVLTLDALNNPLPAWAELEALQVTGDQERIAMVYAPLVHYYQALQKYLRQGNGLYVTDWASMDNSPRNRFIADGGTAVDTSAQMVLFARNLATMATLLGKPAESQSFTREAGELSATINRLMWDPEKRFYFDVTPDGRRAPVKTVAAFWALLGRVASPEQAASLVAELKNPKTFARPLRVPTLAADEPGYDPAGGYWCGSVWASTTMMVLRGLEAYGYHDEARLIALNNLDVMSRVYRETGTIWENYAPEAAKPGQPAKDDFVGWSGLGPIEWLLEFAIGLKPYAPGNELAWKLRSSRRQGCDRYRFGGHVLSLLAQPDPAAAGRFTITVKSDGDCALQLRKGSQVRKVAVHPGGQTIAF